VVGVHPVEADQPCHLIELAISDPGREFNVDDLTQVDENVEKGLWQAAYDERFLDAQSLQPLPLQFQLLSGRSSLPKEYRLAFFFHYLDLAKPLESQ